MMAEGGARAQGPREVPTILLELGDASPGAARSRKLPMHAPFDGHDLISKAKGLFRLTADQEEKALLFVVNDSDGKALAKNKHHVYANVSVDKVDVLTDRFADGSFLLIEVPPPAAVAPAPAAPATQAELEAVRQATIATMEKFYRLAPAAVRPPSVMSLSASGSSSLGAEPTASVAAFSPRSQHFRNLVRQFYGLDNKDRCMTGPGKQTIAHIWPRSLAGEAKELESSLGLPVDFMDDMRNYLIIPRDIHEAFDAEVAVFIPRKDGPITIYVLESKLHLLPESQRAAVRDYQGRVLDWPKKENKPFRRLLGWHAWKSRGVALLGDAAMDAAFDSALSATDRRSKALQLQNLIRDFAMVAKLPIPTPRPRSLSQ